MHTKRTPIYIEQMDNLEQGDILLFRPPKDVSIKQLGIMLLQSLVFQSDGHFDTTHAAICVEKNKDNKAIIAHLTGHNVMGYKKEPLNDMIMRDQGDRAFLVFRPHDKTFAKRIAEIAGNADANKNIKWIYSAAATAFTHHSKLSDSELVLDTLNIKEFDKDSFCSKFVIETLKLATKPDKELSAEISKIYFPHLDSESTPKMLEAYLYKDNNYDMLVFPGKINPYELIKQEILDQLKRIEKNKSDKYKIKFNKLSEALMRAAHEIETHSKKNDFANAILLLKAVIPILQINTGFHIADPDSYDEVMQTARRIGIFERELHLNLTSPPHTNSDSHFEFKHDKSGKVSLPPGLNIENSPILIPIENSQSWSSFDHIHIVEDHAFVSSLKSPKLN